MSPRSRRRRTTLAQVALTLAGLGLSATLAACGGSAGLQPTTGVDGLRIPTPSPDPADFVATIDNRWLPLPVGVTRRYTITGTTSAASAESTATSGPKIAGVPTVTVTTLVLDQQGRRLRSQASSYAQDRAGNVWLLAQRTTDTGAGSTQWAAGIDGARAGLAMAADPRPGDGYLIQDAPGVVRDRATIASVDSEAVTDTHDWRRLVLIEVAGSLPQQHTSREWYAAGEGLVVAERSTVSGSERWVLQAH